LRQDERLTDTPVIFLYGQSQDVDRNRGLQLGAHAQIPKPFSPQRLIEEIRAALSSGEAPGERAVGM
jgi:DNA-binding response OmpR family regulator